MANVQIHSGSRENLSSAQIAIVVSHYNPSITEKLLEGALQTLEQHGIQQIEVARVPGAWEIPLAAAVMARSGKFSAVICLGCVIRGETTHDVHINTQVSHSLGLLALECHMPVSFGVLTCNTVEQAISRSGGSMGNKGVEAAEAALEMLGLLRSLGSDQGT